MKALQSVSHVGDILTLSYSIQPPPKASNNMNGPGKAQAQGLQRRKGLGLRPRDAQPCKRALEQLPQLGARLRLLYPKHHTTHRVKNKAKGRTCTKSSRPMMYIQS